MDNVQAPASFFITLFLIVISTAVVVISRMMLFEKTGRSNVSAFIPFLNFYVMLRLAGMKKAWTFFYVITLLNIYLTLKSMAPLLMPDEINPSRLNLISFLYPFIHPRSINALFLIYWITNGFYLMLYVRLHVRLAAQFGKSVLFGWGMALLEPVFYPVLAFGEAEWKKREVGIKK